MIDKNELRRIAHDKRNKLEFKDELSRSILGKFVSLPEYISASTVMFYIDVRSEVRTCNALAEALRSNKKIVVPWCDDDERLKLFHLENIDELELGMYGILEPSKELRHIHEKQAYVYDIDLIMVPGVAFDTRGARMGHGKGYYDKLLGEAYPETRVVALAFECQMFDEIPVEPHDVFMHKIITEHNIYSNDVCNSNWVVF